MTLKATRDEFGEILVELGSEYPELIVVDADNCTATRTAQFGMDFPTRFINVGVAEQNMIGVAAGLALAGKTPIVSTHAIFLCGRAYEQIRNSVAYSNLNVKLVGTHGGITVGHDGPTHFCFEDLALMRAIPGAVVVVPADSLETRKAMIAMMRHSGLVYLRLGREPVPNVTNDSLPFDIGRGVILREGDNVAIIACGIMVSKALLARETLLQEGIRAAVVDLHTVKPLDDDLICDLAQRCGAVVVAEEHSIYGGLGSAVAEVLARRVPVPAEFVGVPDTFTESGKPGDLLKHYGLESSNLVAAAVKAVRRKSEH